MHLIRSCPMTPFRKTGGTMELTSPAFAHNELIPSKYTCDGRDLSPPLAIKNVPLSAQSLALILDDPDALSGNWVHWLVWNVPPRTKMIAEGTVPSGATEGITSFGRTRYNGPCPPSGIHRYHFTLYAIARRLVLGPEAGKDELLQALEEHILARAELVGLYARKSSID